MASGPVVNAVTLDITSTASIKQAASTLAYKMATYYTGNNTGDNPGNLPSPYYWWEAGAFFSALVDYWYYTGDTSYNAITYQALLSQVGTNYDYMPTNQTKSEGNDDQGFWAMAAMEAAEMNFENPPSSEPGWLALTQAVFNEFVSRWDDSTCGGGLRWQIYTFNTGYNYKNAIANGCLFNVAARLARYTGNDTYAQWADKTWTWMTDTGLMGSGYEVYDGTSNTDNCTSIDHVQWSYNAGIFLFGAAMMYNYTNGSAVWETRTSGVLNASAIFFKDGGIMYEQACEDNGATGNCDTDQTSFKAYMSRWLAATVKVAPFTRGTIMPWLQASAVAAAQQCDGGTGATCGLHWTWNSTNDGLSGVGEQMAGLAIIQANLIDEAPELVTNNTGGTSVGNANAGTGSSSSGSSGVLTDKPVTTGDKAGAGFLTAVMLVGVLGGTSFLIMGV
ncbi:mannan endo-1,6-alpha-mannosidase-3 [Coleophoma cylindrospora]|uniref:Mannan endo-1,6-alpha-mannosidase n=1 Tax=Coleophoma cylindrospora TaxID=1849047 RepID=A0A3D8R1A8_9HELO|nr:mannan endo-1,6-alpha-mannosidase-3 [Coleophoma cylindrospora]